MILPDLLLQATTRATDGSGLLIRAVPKGFVVKNGNGNCLCGFGFQDAEFFQ